MADSRELRAQNATALGRSELSFTRGRGIFGPVKPVNHPHRHHAGAIPVGMILAVLLVTGAARLRAQEGAPAASAAAADSSPNDEAAAASAGAAEAQQLLAQARDSVNELEYEPVLELTDKVLALEGVPVDLRMDAYLLRGSSLAILGRETDAEKAFRYLLRGRPTFDLPADGTPPKILRVFRNVKVEEDRIRAETAALERKRMLEGLSLTGAPYTQIIGGDPVTFSYFLRDPRGVVGSVRINYRRDKGGDFAVLPLEINEEGAWSGVIPATWTENEDGFVLQYSVETSGRNGEPLLSIGAPPEDPMTLKVAAGSIEGRTPFYKKTWFWLASGAAVVGGTFGLVYLYRNQTRVPASDLGPVTLP